MKDTFEFTLKENPIKELYEMLSDVDVETTPSFTIQDTHGNIAEYVKVIRCYECRYIHYEDGLVWMCNRTNTPTGGIEGYCAWAEPQKESEQ